MRRANSVSVMPMWKTFLKAEAILLAVLLAGCQGGKPASNQRLCTLSLDKTSFLCDVEFQPEDSKCTPTASARREFVSRMTAVSLEMLYLDREPGGTPPYRYNDLNGVFSRIRVIACRKGCECRLEYSDPDLERIFYDSAGCRVRSRFEAHPLYFVGRGCR